MKQTNFLIIAFVALITITGSSTLNAADMVNAGFEARKLKGYAPNNLTITSLYGSLYMGDITCEKSGLRLYDIILAVNGKDVNKLSNEELNDILVKSPRVHLTIISSTDWKEHVFSYKPINMHLKGRNELFGFSMYESNIITMNNKALNINVYNDEDIDFSQYKTIDVLVVGEDPLREKEIATMAMNRIIEKSHFPLKRDTENPDLLLKVAFNESHSVHSTYVPPTTTYTDGGTYSTITKTKTGYLINNFKRLPKKKTTGGYTYQDVSANHYLEICILDAKKMADPNIKVAPIVWQLTYNKTFSYEANFKAILNRYVFDNLHSFPRTLRLGDPCHWYSGIYWDEHPSKSIIADVMINSPAEKMGLKAGDEVLKINGRSDAKPTFMHFFNEGSNCVKKDVVNRNEFIFEKQPFYKVVPNAKVSKSIYNFFEYRNQHAHTLWDRIDIIPPYWFNGGNEVEVQIKRNGKKMKLKGVLYGLLPVYWYRLHSW